jgi:hypothetical protein
MRAAAASSFGSQPPNCSATGCSAALCSSKRRASPRIKAVETIISVYNKACGAYRRCTYRQWVSVQSIIGATQMRRSKPFIWLV